MPSWRPYTLSAIPGVDTAMSAVNTVGSTLSTLLNTLSGILNVLSTISAFMSDEMYLATIALKNAIQELIDQISNLLNTGLYFYVDKGPLFTGEDPDGLHGFIRRWKASFEDEGDSARPQFTAGIRVSALLFVVGSNGLPDFQPLLDLLAKLFGLPSLQWSGTTHEADIPERIEASMGTPPDWEALRLGKVLPPFARLAEKLQKVAGLITVSYDYAHMLKALADIIEQKAELLSNLSNEIEAVQNDINALVNSDGLYVLHLEGDSISDIIQQAEEATEVPPWDLESWVAGTCLLGATGDFSPVIELLGG